MWSVFLFSCTRICVQFKAKRKTVSTIWVCEYIIILVKKSAGIIIVYVEIYYNDVRIFSRLYWGVPEERNMSTIKDEEALYQNLNILSWTYKYIHIYSACNLPDPDCADSFHFGYELNANPRITKIEDWPHSSQFGRKQNLVLWVRINHRSYFWILFYCTKFGLL